MGTNPQDGPVFGTWPTRQAPQVDRFTVAVEKLTKSLQVEVGTFDGGKRGKGWPWWQVGQDGLVFCSVRVAGRLFIVDPTTRHYARIFDTKEQAKEFYVEFLQGVEAGEYDERIREHLKSIPSRKRRTAS